MEHPICGGNTLDDSTEMNVISFGNEAFGDDLDELKKKGLTPPKYLEKATGLLRGPEVFEFVAWSRSGICTSKCQANISGSGKTKAD